MHIFDAVWALLNLSIVGLLIGGVVFIFIKVNSIDKSLKELVKKFDK